MKSYLMWVLALSSGVALAADVSMTVGDIKDSRTNGKFFNELEIELSLKGDVLEKVDRYRLRLDAAVDDTGRDLLQKERSDNDFEDAHGFGSSQPDQISVDLKFRNPARKAEKVKEIRGVVELYAPSLDPAAVVAFPQVRAKKGQALETPATRAAGIKLLVAVKDGAEAPKPKPAAEAANSLQAMAESFGSLFGGDAFAVLLKLEDPQGRVAGYQVVDGQGKVIKSRSRSTMNKTMITLGFEDQLPADVGLVLQLKTEKSLIRLPVALADIPLP
jgi:hypothetical protein